MDKLEKYIKHADKIKIPDSMKATILTGAGFENIAVRDIHVPEPGPDQLLARVDAAGVCTSILKIIDQGKKHKYLYGWNPGKWPLIMGDEGSVTIVKAGDNLKDKYKIDLEVRTIGQYMLKHPSYTVGETLNTMFEIIEKGDELLKEIDAEEGEI